MNLIKNTINKIDTLSEEKRESPLTEYPLPYFVFLGLRINKASFGICFGAFLTAVLLGISFDSTSPILAGIIVIIISLFFIIPYSNAWNRGESGSPD